MRTQGLKPCLAARPIHTRSPWLLATEESSILRGELVTVKSCLFYYNDMYVFFMKKRVVRLKYLSQKGLQYQQGFQRGGNVYLLSFWSEVLSFELRSKNEIKLQIILKYGQSDIKLLLSKISSFLTALSENINYYLFIFISRALSTCWEIKVGGFYFFLSKS